MPDKKFKTLLVWLRRDLRLQDNRALHEACRQAERVVPLFVFDPDILGREDTGAARVAFLLDALRVLESNLQKCGGRLVLRQGKAPEEIVRAVDDFGADGVFHQREYEPFGRRRDESVASALRERGKVIQTFPGLALFEPEEVLSKTGTPYTVFGPYKREWFSRPADPPLPAPRHVPVPPEAKGEALPTAAGLKFSVSQTFTCGGEDAAHALLREFLESKIDGYDAGRDILAESGTSLLSRHLHLGTISARFVVDAVRRARKDKPSGGTPGEHQPEPGHSTFLSEVAWHDFYLQILHHFPHVAEGAFRPQFDALAWENEEALFAAWKEGRTGYPIVDAAMRQMNHAAWMHNRGRMVVASFLTKDLLIDWRWGERYFMQMLVDGDQAANNGGWQWAAGTGTDAQPFFRIFNPTSQGEKFDPEGAYVKRWVPELAQVPPKFIHAPWKLSPAEREHLGCAAYPGPVVDHATRRGRALAMYGKVTEQAAEKAAKGISMRRWTVMAVAGAILVGGAAPGRAQTPPQTASSGRPDVVVLVIPQDGKGDLVDITYSGAVPRAQVQGDLDALRQATGWAIGPSRITDGPGPGQPKRMMTSSVFTAPGVIQGETHALPVEPFITAFRAYKRLVLIFSAPADFQFQGRRDYADNNVQIALEQHGAAYTYQVRILDSRFTHLNLSQTPQPAAAVTARRPSPWVLFLGILAAATAAGSLVYIVMARRNGPPPPALPDALSEERTKIGTRG